VDQDQRAQPSPAEKSPKTPRTHTHTPRTQRATRADIEGEIARVRAREEKRLLTLADKAGLFDWRIPSQDLRTLFDAARAVKPRKPSQLFKLRKRLNRLAKARRSDATKRKIILGGFVVAQCRHKPDLHTRLAADITAYFDASKNRDPLAGFLADPHHTSVSDTSKQSEAEATPGDTHRARTHRQILLGTWLLARYRDLPVLTDLIATELDGFLAEETHPERRRALLADLRTEPAPSD